MAFYRGKRHTTLLSWEWMGEAFSDKEVAFSLCRVIPRQGEDCSIIKLSEWLNAIAEHSESAHHHSMTVKKETRKQETRTKWGARLLVEKILKKQSPRRTVGFIFQHIYMIKLNSKLTKRQKKIFPVLVCLSVRQSGQLLTSSPVLCLTGWKASAAPRDKGDLIFICERLWTPLNDTLQRLDVPLPFLS